MKNTIKKQKTIRNKKTESFQPAVEFAVVKWQPKYNDAQLTRNEMQYAKSEKYGPRV